MQETGTGLISSGHRNRILVARQDWMEMLRITVTTDLALAEVVRQATLLVSRWLPYWVMISPLCSAVSLGPLDKNRVGGQARVRIRQRG